MVFLAPLALATLVLLPLLAGFHLLGFPTRPRATVRLSSLGLLGPARARHPWRRHVSGTFFLLGLGLLSLGAARPIAELQVPAQDVSVVLALDLSGSMRADDITPTRLAAAEAAALRFLEAAPQGTRVGLVVFNEQARVMAPPTTEHQTLRVILGGLQASGATAIGDALLLSLSVLREQGDVQAALLRAAQGAIPQPAPSGKVGVVLLTDGESNAGEDPDVAASTAAFLGVQVFTVGLGTRNGVIQDSSGDPVGVGFDEETLRKLARQTGGRYYYAPSRQEVERVFSDLAGRITWRKEKLELSFAACALALPFLLLGVALSQRWTQRFP